MSWCWLNVFQSRFDYTMTSLIVNYTKYLHHTVVKQIAFGVFWVKRNPVFLKPVETCAHKRLNFLIFWRNCTLTWMCVNIYPTIGKCNEQWKAVHQMFESTFLEHVQENLPFHLLTIDGSAICVYWKKSKYDLI